MMEKATIHTIQYGNTAIQYALTYTDRPEDVFREVLRVLRPGGKLLAVTLRKHNHVKAVEPFNHVNLGFSREQLSMLASEAGLDVQACTVSAIEKRTPNFSVLALSATKACTRTGPENHIK